MTIDLTRRAGYRDSIRTEIIGTQGSIVADFILGGSVNVQWEDRHEVIALASSNVIADAVQAQLHAFAEAVRNGASNPNAAGALDSRYALLAATALYQSRRAAAWRAVPL
jgi:predicted dehydrogenase